MRNDQKRQNSQSALKSMFLTVPLILVSGLLLSGCMPSEKDVADAEALVEKAQEYVSNSEYANAMKKYEEAKNLDEGNGDIYSGIASIYLIKNRPEDAKEMLLAGLPTARKTALIHEYLGEIALGDEELDDAIDYLKKAVKEDSEAYRAAYLLGVAYVEKGSDDNARDALDISEDGGEWYVRGALLSAVTYWEDTDSAKELLNAAVDTDIDQSITSLIDVYLEDIAKVEALAEDEPEVYRDVILAHGSLNAGYGGIVVEKLKPYIEDEPNYWDLFLYLGSAYEIEREFDQAQEYLEKAVELNPADPIGPWHLARVYAELGMEDEMVLMYERAIALSEVDDRVSIRLEFTEQLQSTERNEDFDEQVAALIAEDADNAMSYELMNVESLVKRELYPAALTSLDEIVQDDLTEELQAEYSWLKGSILFAQGERDQAAEWAQDAVTTVPTDARYQLLLGQIYYETNEEDKATIALERAIDLDLEGDVSAEAMKVLDRM